MTLSSVREVLTVDNSTFFKTMRMLTDLCGGEKAKVLDNQGSIERRDRGTGYVSLLHEAMTSQSRVSLAGTAKFQTLLQGVKREIIIVLCVSRVVVLTSVSGTRATLLTTFSLIFFTLHYY